MELREYYQIIRKNRSVFWIVVILVMLVSFAYFSLKPISYKTSLTINITRKGTQDTADYKFDNFYRLQADERFTETIVEWLKSPYTVTEIYSRAGIDFNGASLRKLTKLLGPEKRSSQIAVANFSAKSREEAKKISDSIASVLEINTEKLNKDQNDNTWFIIVAHEPVIVEDSVNTIAILAVAAFVGLILAFWAVMIWHYLR